MASITKQQLIEFYMRDAHGWPSDFRLLYPSLGMCFLSEEEYQDALRRNIEHRSIEYKSSS